MRVPGAGSRRWRPSDLALVAVASFAMQGGIAAYGALINPLVVKDLHLGAQALGGLESLREVPGFLSVLLAAVTVRVREANLAAAALFVMAIGLASIAWTHTWVTLVLAGMVWSIGFHLFSPLNNSLALSAVDESQAGRALGFVGGVGAVGGIAVLVLVILAVGSFGRAGTFIPSGILVLIGAIALLFMRKTEMAPRPRLLLRRRYSIYYMLTFLDGSRRQIFSTFAVFLLAQNYHLDVRQLVPLLILNGIVTAATTPSIGRLIDRYGERRMLTLNYACLIPLFAGYALVHNIWILGTLYCIDNVFFSFGLGINSYLGRIAPAEDRTPSLVMGTTVNHIAAVGIPILGGVLWASVGYQVTFLAGAATCLLSVFTSLAIPPRNAIPSIGVRERERRGELSVTALGHAEGAVAIVPEEH
ncbi:MAG: MFS transporter [Chloroflexota bacterium]